MTTASKTETPNVYQRLNAARSAFHATKLKKTGKNTFAGYSYFELGDFLIPALQIFAEHGLCAVISFSSERAFMEIRNIDDPAEMIEITSPMGSAALKGCHEVQNIGAVETYQRRYLWTAALEIVEHDALDATTGRDAGGQSNGAQSAPGEPETYTFPPGPAKGITEMKAMARALWREIEGCGDQSELNPLLDIAENKALLKQMSLLENPAHREIWEGDGKDNPGIAGLITRKETEFAMHMADLART